MWGGGICLPLIPLWCALRSLVQGNALIVTRRGFSVLETQGWPAPVLNLSYVALALSLHFHFFWGNHEALQRYHQPCTVAAFGAFVFGLLAVVAYLLMCG